MNTEQQETIEALTEAFRNVGTAEADDPAKVAETLPNSCWVEALDGTRTLNVKGIGGQWATVETHYLRDQRASTAAEAAAKAAEPAPKSPETLRREATAAYIAARRQAAAAPLCDPAPGVPDHELNAAEYVARRRFLRSLGKRV